ncbi:MAG: LamG-like jellyroll fold domain-containing protein [Candidatus Diapherotrites archaeon]
MKTKFSFRGQGALEYLLLIGGAVLIAAIAIMVVTNLSGGGQEQIEQGELTYWEQIGRIEALGDPTLVGYWQFEGYTRDSSQYGNNGTAYNNPIYVSGYQGKAIEFNGSNQYVQVNDNPSLRGMPQLKIDLWVYPHSYPSINPSWAEPLRKGSDYVIVYENSSSCVLQFWVFNETGVSANSNIPCTETPLNQWSHLTATWDGAVQRFYVNGVEKGTRNFSGTSVNSDTAPLYFGDFVGLGRPFDGVIDEVKIYNKT